MGKEVVEKEIVNGWDGEDGVNPEDQAAFWKTVFGFGDEGTDELIVSYIKTYMGRGHNKRFGVPYPRLEIYFCYKKSLMDIPLVKPARLRARLDTLCKLGILYFEKINGVRFYFLK